MTQILLIGTETPLLEGLAQSFAALGLTTSVVHTLHEAREMAAQQAPLIAIVSHTLAAESTGETLNVPLAPGGALVLYRTGASGTAALSPTLQRAPIESASRACGGRRRSWYRRRSARSRLWRTDG